MSVSYIAWVAILLAIVFFIANYFLINKQQKKIEAIELALKTLQNSSESSKKQFTEVHAVSLGMGKKLQKLDALVKKTQENHLNLVAQAPENRLYTRAVKMVELGASIDELMTECELPRAEAELLLNLHKK